MELDGYNKELEIAFEYQGGQHYKFVKGFHKTKENYFKLVERDKLKQEVCKEHNIDLIIIPYTINRSDLYEFIIRECKKRNIDIPAHKKKEIKDLDVFGRKKLIEMKLLAQQRKGECLSTNYYDSYTKLIWKCREGHTWKAHPHSVKNSNSWCPFCAGKVKKTVGDMIELASSKGGEFISNEYLGLSEKHSWKCGEGHIWRDTPANLISNDFCCPICENRRRRYTLNDMQKFANKGVVNVFQRNTLIKRRN